MTKSSRIAKLAGVANSYALFVHKPSVDKQQTCRTAPLKVRRSRDTAQAHAAADAVCADASSMPPAVGHWRYHISSLASQLLRQLFHQLQHLLQRLQQRLQAVPMGRQPELALLLLLLHLLLCTLLR